MCELAVEHTSTWLMVDPWEAGQPEYQRTAVVLDHFNTMLNGEGGGVVMSDGRKRKYKIMLLAGGDLIESFGEPGVWSEPDVSGIELALMLAYAPSVLALYDDWKTMSAIALLGCPSSPAHLASQSGIVLIAAAHHSRPLRVSHRRTSRIRRLGLPTLA
jgi:nicotinic acid mononucleotide adenylyltransferase